MKLSELLKNARAERGLSLEAAAREMGTTKGHLHDMEQGEQQTQQSKLLPESSLPTTYRHR